MGNERDRMEQVYQVRRMLTPRYRLDNPGNRFNYEQLRSGIARRLVQLFPTLDIVRCLDLGSGTLFWPEELIRIGISRDRCFGADLLISRLKEGYAAGRHLPVVACSAAQIPFPDNSFHLVTQFTMMTSVLDDTVKRRIVAEMVRVLKPGGFILWYDFRYSNPSNPNARGIGRRELKSLFPDLPISLETTTLLPPLARKLKGSLSPLLNFLHRLPILRSHYLAVMGPKG